MEDLYYVLFIFLSLVLIWLVRIIYNIVYYPANAYHLIPRRIKTWRWLAKLGVTDRSTTFTEIEDRFTSVAEITKAMRVNGLERVELIIGIDFTASNEWQGRKTFAGKSLHHIAIESKSHRISKWNPYQRVIRAIGGGLHEYDEDNLIPVFGFGDERTKDKSVFPLMDDPSPCNGIEDVLMRYTRTVGSVTLSGPTSFAPVIRKAIEIVELTGKYHILLIIADGRVEEQQDVETRDAIVEASNHPLSIVLVGVGDGPWNMMHEYDDKIPMRRFDNFQFVEFLDKKATRFSRDVDSEFALQALMEIPDQYRAIRSLGLLGNALQEDSVDCNKNAGVVVKRRKKCQESHHVTHVTRRRSVEGILETDL